MATTLAIIRIKRVKIFPSQARQMLRIVQLAGNEPALLVEARKRIGLKSPAFFAWQPRRARSNLLPIRTMTERDVRRALALNPVRLPYAQELVAVGIVQRLAE